MSRIPRFAALLWLAALIGACSPAPAEHATSEPAPESQPQSTEPAAAESTPAPTSSPEPKPKVYRGAGSKVIRIKPTNTPGLITAITRGGSGNFTVYDIGPSGEERELLANGIGDHQGTRMYNLDGEKTVALKVQADGRWKITLKPITASRDWDTSAIAGLGDDVLVLRPESNGFQTIASRCVCDGNFTVRGYDGDAEESLLANEIGDSKAEDTLPDGTILVAVEGDGAWVLQRTGVN